MKLFKTSVLILALLSPLTFTLAVAAPKEAPPQCKKQQCAPPPAEILGNKPDSCVFDPNSESRCCFYPQVIQEENKKQECLILVCQSQCDLPWEMVKRLCKPPVEKFDI